MTRTLAALLVVGAAACGPGSSPLIEPSANVPLAAHPPTSLAPESPTTATAHRRMVPPEAFLRSYLTWFGGLAPADVQKRGGPLLEQWDVYLAALGLPGYADDFPRATQSNPVMLSTQSALGEALCIRAAEHDFHPRGAHDARLVFKFDEPKAPTLAEFATPFDVLHRTFLGYPATLAPAERIPRFYALYQHVAAAHPTGPLTADESGWVAVCAALVVHPEAELY